MSEPHLVVYGDALIDEEIVVEACETRKNEFRVRSTGLEQELPGGAANAARILQGFLPEARVSAWLPDEWPSRKIRFYDAAGERLYRVDIDRQPVAGEVATCVENACNSIRRGADGLLLSGYGKGAEAGHAYEAVLAVAHEHQVRTVVNSKRHPVELAKVSPNAVFSMNLAEFLQHTGEEQAEWDALPAQVQKARRLWGAGALCVTCSHYGVVWATAGAADWVRVPVVVPAQTVGAGDAFASGFLRYWVCLDRADLSQPVVQYAAQLAAAGAVVYCERPRTEPVLSEHARACHRELLVADFLSRSTAVVPTGDFVFVNGCFDLFHAGHQAVVQAAVSEAQQGGMGLLIAVNSDAYVAAHKGDGRPVRPVRWRLLDAAHAALRAGMGQRQLFLGEFGGNEWEWLRERQLWPSVVVKGEEYRSSAHAWPEGVGKPAPRIAYAPFVPGISTTQLLSRPCRY